MYVFIFLIAVLLLGVCLFAFSFMAYDGESMAIVGITMIVIAVFGLGVYSRDINKCYQSVCESQGYDRANVVAEQGVYCVRFDDTAVMLLDDRSGGE